MKDQRLSARLLRQWDMIRQDCLFPEVQQFSVTVGEDLWPSCCLISISHDTKGQYKFKCEYMGKPIVELYRRDLTGLYMDEKLKQFPAMIMFGGLTNVLTERCPREDAGFYFNEAGKVIKYRTCFLPFGDSKKKDVTHIVAGLSCRECS